MRKSEVLFGLMVASASLAATASADAAVTLTKVNVETPSNNAMMAYGFTPSTVIDFDNIKVGSSTFTTGGATFSGAGSVVNGTTPYAFQAPKNDTSNYLADGTNKTFNKATDNIETISFANHHNGAGLYWGSIDQYNTLTFLLNGKVVGTFNGVNVANASNGSISIDPAAFDPKGNDKGNSFYNKTKANGSYGGTVGAAAYVTFKGQFDTIKLATTQPNFEIDNLAVGGVPEPGTWAMMLIGFCGLGVAAFARSKTSRAVLPLAA